MNMTPIIPVILAGGAGTRLWPISRDALPKQFLPLLSDRSTYQEALLRVQGPMFGPPVVVTGPDFHFFARRQAEELGIDATVVIEPVRRDSAAALAAGAAVARRRDSAAVVLALAADHIILDPDKFQKTCHSAHSAAAGGLIVTFGIRPTEPKTSYGYILPGEPIDDAGVRRVARFVEKPDAAAAANYLAQGYLWNSGNFLFRADTLLSELARFEPALAQVAIDAVEQAKDDLGFLRLDRESFAQAPQTSIDYAVMERTDRLAVIGGNFRWSDIGSWDALFEIRSRDANGNVLHGPAVTLDVENCIVHSEQRLSALIGVRDLIVVTTPDAVLVVPRGRSQEVRDLVAMLKEAKRSEATVHRRVHRPWGYYESIDTGERFQVKRIVVVPGGVLSLQKHKHRAEHWVIVRGAAEVTLGPETRTVHENESTFIPIGSVHRLANRGRIPLELIEVQTGSYLGEDDIVRLEDVYRRA
jgi:mannose-1-phosphate guanylyltransferase/mannose-6-phosphate isomerase